MEDKEIGKVIVIGHMGMDAQGITQRIMAEQGLKESDVIIVDSEMGMGSSIKRFLDGTVKETQQLSEIIKDDRDRMKSIGIAQIHGIKDVYHKSQKEKKPYWKNGKLRKK